LGVVGRKTSLNGVAYLSWTLRILAEVNALKASVREKGWKIRQKIRKTLAEVYSKIVRGNANTGTQRSTLEEPPRQYQWLSGSKTSGSRITKQALGGGGIVEKDQLKPGSKQI